MSTLVNDSRDMRDAVVEGLKRNWGWFLFVGVVIMMLGAASIALPFASSLAVELLIGSALLAGGVMRFIHAVKSRAGNSFFAELILVLAMLAVGALLLLFPLKGMLTLTVLLAAYFMVSGIFRIIAALQTRYVPAWGWAFVSGIIALILGAVIWAELPGDARWILGFFIGIDLLFSGLTLILMGVGVKRLS